MLKKLRCINIHIHHKCNLSCDGCNHFSDLTNSETPDVDEDQFLKDVEFIAKNIRVTDHLAILGGEPLLNKNFRVMFSKALNLFSKHGFPTEKIRLYTNGLLLHKHLYLRELMDVFKFELYISVHVTKESKLYKPFKKHIKHFFRSSNFTSKSMKVIKKISPYRVKRPITVYNDSSWRKQYLEKEGKIYPYLSKDLKGSFENCSCPNAQVLDGKIFKCAPIAYLPYALKYTGQLDDPFWKPFLNYKGYNLDKIDDFLSKHDKPESICAMCPSKPNWIKKKDRKLVDKI